jgi:hypothetical protein
MYERVEHEPLVRGVDKYGIAVVRGSQPLTQLRGLGALASRCTGPAEFYAATDALNTEERRVLGVVTDVLAGLDDVQDAEGAAWRVLGSGLVVLELPVDDSAGGPRSSLRSWIECRVSDPPRRQQIEDALFHISAEYDKHGGSLDRQRLDEELLCRGHRLTQDKSAPVLIALESMVSVRTDEVLAALDEREVDRVSLDVQPLVRAEDRAIQDPEAVIAEVVSDGQLLKAVLAAQGDRALVLAGRAHIPLAALIGYLVTDRARVRILDWHPNVGDESWAWPTNDDVLYPDLDVLTSGAGSHVAVLFSLSFAIGDVSKAVAPPRVVDAVGSPDRVVRLTHPGLSSSPSLRAEAVRSARQARAYGEAFRRVLDGLTDRAERVDVFYAGPLSVAFEIGRSVTGTFHPPVRVWNYADGRYGWAVELNPRSEAGAERTPRAVQS